MCRKCCVNSPPRPGTSNRYKWIAFFWSSVNKKFHQTNLRDISLALRMWQSSESRRYPRSHSTRNSFSLPGSGTRTRSATGCSVGARSPGPSRTPPAWCTRPASRSQSQSRSRCPSRSRTGSGKGPPTPSRPSKTPPSELICSKLQGDWPCWI